MNPPTTRRQSTRNRHATVAFTPPSPVRRGHNKARRLAAILRASSTRPALPLDDEANNTPPNDDGADAPYDEARFLVFLATPEGQALAASHSPARTMRSLEDVLLKILEPNNVMVADLDVAVVLTGPARALLMKMLKEHRIDHYTAEDLSYDGQLQGVANALQALNPVLSGPTVAQLEGAAAKQAPAETKPKSVEDFLNACLFPTKELTLDAIASPEHARVIQTIVRAARAKLPCDQHSCTPEAVKNLAYAELHALAPGYNTPSLEQLTAAVVPINPPSKKSRRAGANAHLMTFDPQLRGVCQDALDDDDVSDDIPEFNHSNRVQPRSKPVVKQVDFAVSAALHRRTSEPEMRAWNLQKNLGRQKIAAWVFGPNGDSLGAFEPGMMKTCKDAAKAFKNCLELREHVDALYETYKNEMITYDHLVGQLDWTTGTLAFPPGKYDEVILPHLELCTSHVTYFQRSNFNTWGQNFMTLWADYTEWADLPEATFDTVMCALKARNVYSTPLWYTGRKALTLAAPPAPVLAAPALAPPARAAPAPAAPTRPPTTRPTGHATPAATGPAAPKGNIAIAGVTVLPWSDIVKNSLCANCYSAAHAATACTVLCRKKCCHPPWLARFDGHARKDCKAR